MATEPVYAPLRCDKCGFSTRSAQLAVGHVQAHKTHKVTGPGQGKENQDTWLTIEVVDLAELDK